MYCNVVRYIAFYFILWIIFRSMMSVTLIIESRRVYFYDFTRHSACLRIPTYVIAYFKCFIHILFLYREFKPNNSILIGNTRSDNICRRCVSMFLSFINAHDVHYFPTFCF